MEEAMPEDLSGVGFVPMPRMNKEPVIQIDEENNIVWQDGVKIMHWQMSDEEMKKWLPRLYQTTRMGGRIECPLCGHIMPGGDKRAIVQHIRAPLHQDCWDEIGPKVSAMTLNEVMDYLTDRATRPK